MFPRTFLSRVIYNYVLSCRVEKFLPYKIKQFVWFRVCDGRPLCGVKSILFDEIGEIFYFFEKICIEVQR